MKYWASKSKKEKEIFQNELETLTPLPKASPGSIKISIGQPLHWRLVGSANNERENASWQILLDFRFINYADLLEQKFQNEFS